MSDSKRQVLRQSRLSAETPKHRVQAEKQTEDSKVHNQGRKLSSSPRRRLVRSPAISSSSSEQEIDCHLREDCQDDQEGQDSGRSGRKASVLHDATPSVHPKVLGLPRPQRAPTITCAGPTDSVPCLSCRWAQQFLEQGSCLMVEPEYSDSDSEGTQDASVMAAFFSKHGEDDSD